MVERLYVAQYAPCSNQGIHPICKNSIKSHKVKYIIKQVNINKTK